MLRNVITVTAALSAVLFIEPTAHADPNPGYSYFVGAPSCQLASESTAGIAVAVNGTWTFDGSDVGTFTLLCPIDFQDSSAFQWSTWEMWYRDQSGFIGSGEVEVSLRHRTGTGTGYVVDDTLSSNSDSSTLPNRLSDPLAVATVQDVAYFLHVTLFRDTGYTGSVYFTGVKFEFDES